MQMYSESDLRDTIDSYFDELNADDQANILKHYGVNSPSNLANENLESFLSDVILASGD